MGGSEKSPTRWWHGCGSTPPTTSPRTSPATSRSPRVRWRPPARGAVRRRTRGPAHAHPRRDDPSSGARWACRAVAGESAWRSRQGLAPTRSDGVMNPSAPSPAGVPWIRRRDPPVEHMTGQDMSQREVPLGINTALGAVAVTVLCLMPASLDQQGRDARFAVLAVGVFAFAATVVDPLAVAVTAGVAFLLFDGFVEGRQGDLVWNGRSDL